MKNIKRAVAFLLAIVLLCTVSCGKTTDGTTATTATTATTSTTTIPAGKTTCYNIIFALATIPPVLAALESISNGYQTYAIIERGKTYSGIDSVEYFHNAGFDPKSNLSTGFTEDEFNSMVAKVSELKGEDVYFNFYVQDGTALMAAAIAANAGITSNDFHVYMCEDGTGAYNALKRIFIDGKTVNSEKDEVYDTYSIYVSSASTEFDDIMKKSDNKYNDPPLTYNIGKAYALAALPNFTYCLQDEANIISIIGGVGETKTALGTAFGIEGYTLSSEYTLSLKYCKIAEAVAELSTEQRTDYLTLMYGDYYEGTYAALTRTERAGEKAPDKKLVFIGSRHMGYPDFASNDVHGIGSHYTVPNSYESLPDKYKTELLFPTKADYDLFLNVINDPANYSDDITDAARISARWACFSYYVDYIYTLKLAYALYGEEYDIIMKGHPREVIGEYEQWGGQYLVGYGEGLIYCFDKLMDKSLVAFHESDSVGKYIGTVPYGTSAENLAYLGANISLGGLPSSTYNGFDLSVDVVFIIAETNESIDGSASQVKSRYEAGTLSYTDENGEIKTTVFLNTGNIYKALISIYEKSGNGDMANKYRELFEQWLAQNRDGATDIDEQGFAKN